MSRPLSTTPELPTLDAGVSLLERDDRTTGALQSLVLDHALVDRGRAVWVDARGNGTTRPLARLAPSMRALDRVRIARAFTPWQHLSLLRDLPAELDDRTSIVVLPALDWFYRSEDLRRGEGKRLLADATTLVADLAAETDAPILLTRTEDDAFSSPLEDLADDCVACESTPFGPRFSGDDFETLVYPIDDGLVQTTLAFWSRVLADRHPALAASPTPEVTTRGSY